MSFKAHDRISHPNDIKPSIVLEGDRAWGGRYVRVMQQSVDKAKLRGHALALRIRKRGRFQGSTTGAS